MRGVNLIYFEQVLSERQLQIYHLQKKGESYARIAYILGISKDSVNSHMKRIKKKKEKTKLPDMPTDDIATIFQDETEKHKKLTVAQAQFLSNKANMHTIDRKKKSYFKRKTGTVPKNKVTKRIMSESELEQARKNIVEQREKNQNGVPPKRIMALKKRYYEQLENNNTKIEDLASMEIELRAYGVIYKTPNVNKLNQKTGKILRAKQEGKTVINIRPGEKNSIPQNAKHIETVHNDRDKSTLEYSVWIY